MPVIYDLVKTPDIDIYIAGLKAIQPKMKPEHFRIFQAQYFAPGRAASAKELALAAGVGGGHPTVNSLYGRLGHMFCDATGFAPELIPHDQARWWAVWSTGYSVKGRGFLWVMRAQVAEALQRLGWVDDKPMLEEALHGEQEKRTARSMHCPSDERLARLASASALPARVCVLRTEFQRNPDVVAAVMLAAAGRCDLCGAEAPFKRQADDQPYLEVHHIVPLSRGGEDTIGNTVALCPNCHREAHYGQSKKRHEKRLKQTAKRRAGALGL